MKHNPITLITGAILLLIFAFMLFTFQVRQTEVAVWTTFGRPTGSITNAGFYWRAPWPIQSVYKFDQRIQSFERKFEQTSTADAKSVIVSIFVGWQIADPLMFLQRFGTGDQLKAAEAALESVVSNAKKGVISQHPFSDLVSTNRAELKFDEIETQMRDRIRKEARESFGIDIAMVGIKQLGLPESITAKIFDRMRADRMVLVKDNQAQGDQLNVQIKSEADLAAQTLLNKAKGQATIIEGQGDAAASKSLAVFEQNPQLAVFLLRLRTLAASLTNRTTIVADQNMPPFNMLSQMAVTNAPTAAPMQTAEQSHK